MIGNIDTSCFVRVAEYPMTAGLTHLLPSFPLQSPNNLSGLRVFPSSLQTDYSKVLCIFQRQFSGCSSEKGVYRAPADCRQACICPLDSAAMTAH